jgi:hypothetical protein
MLASAYSEFGIDAYNTGKRQGGHLRIIEKKVSKDGKARPNVWVLPPVSEGLTGGAAWACRRCPLVLLRARREQRSRRVR